MSQLTRIVVTDGDVEDMVASGMVAAENRMSNAVRQIDRYTASLLKCCRCKSFALFLLLQCFAYMYMYVHQ